MFPIKYIDNNLVWNKDNIGIIAGGVLGYEGKLNANENLEQLFMDVVKNNHREG